MDNNPTIQPATAPNTRFVLADIMQASFLTMLREQLDVALAAAPAAQSAQGAVTTLDPPWCALLGVHLCGPLSPRAIDLFHACKQLHAIILVPCCLDPRTDGELKADARARGVDPYEAKVEQLTQMLRCADTVDISECIADATRSAAGQGINVSVVRDTTMRTNKGGATSEGGTQCKNAVITGVRQRLLESHCHEKSHYEASAHQGVPKVLEQGSPRRKRERESRE